MSNFKGKGAPKGVQRLSYKQQMFVEAYLRTWSATQAARETGYGTPHSAGPRLLKNLIVREAIEKRIKESAMGADEVLARLSEQARINIAEFVTVKMVPTSTISPIKKDDEDEDEDDYGDDAEEPKISAGGFVQVAELNWDAILARGHLVKSIKNTKYGPALELHDGQVALVQVGKFHKLFVERQDISGMVVHQSDPQDQKLRDEFNRSISELAKALGEILPGAGAEPHSPMGSGQ